MSDVNTLIRKLYSPKASDRYDACELLRVTPALSPEAISALQATLEDSDQSVAESAASALNAHGAAIAKPAVKPPPPLPTTADEASLRRRIPNWAIALIVGLGIALASTPGRIRDFTDPNNPTIDRFIVMQYGLEGAVLRHIVIDTVVFGLIAFIVLAIARRAPKATPRPDTPPGQSRPQP